MSYRYRPLRFRDLSSGSECFGCECGFGQGAPTAHHRLAFVGSVKTIGWGLTNADEDALPPDTDAYHAWAWLSENGLWFADVHDVLKRPADAAEGVTRATPDQGRSASPRAGRSGL